MGRTRSGRDQLIAFQRAHRRLPDPARLATKGPTCRYPACGRAFEPTRPWQRYCQDAHRVQHWRDEQRALRERAKAR